MASTPLKLMRSSFLVVLRTFEVILAFGLTTLCLLVLQRSTSNPDIIRFIVDLGVVTFALISWGAQITALFPRVDSRFIAWNKILLMPFILFVTWLISITLPMLGIQFSTPLISALILMIIIIFVEIIVEERYETYSAHSKKKPLVMAINLFFAAVTISFIFASAYHRFGFVGSSEIGDDLTKLIFNNGLKWFLENA